MHEAAVVLRLPLVADDEPPGVAEPGERPLDLPAPLVPPQYPPVLRLRSLPLPTMRRDHRDPAPRQPRVQRVGVVRPIADEPFGHRPHPPGIHHGIYAGDLMRRS